MISAVSFSLPSPQRAFNSSRKTNMNTNKFTIGKITDQKKPMLEPT